MKLHSLALVACAVLPATVGCTLGNDTGMPYPGQYWPWVCPDLDGGSPFPASTPIDYVASGSCGPGGPFELSVDGCEIFGTWSAVGLADVQTTQPVGSPELGGWSVTAENSPDGGAAADGGSLNCSAAPAADGGLTFTCSEAASSATVCQSALTPASGP